MGSDPTTAPRYYYVYNTHGDVVALVDANGNAVSSYSYDAFGAVLTDTDNFANGWRNPYLYVGAARVRYDAETALYWMSVRAYDPSTGRFISRDPLGRAPAIGLAAQPYVYADNNPLTYLDPSGQIIVSATGWQGGYAVPRRASTAVVTQHPRPGTPPAPQPGRGAGKGLSPSMAEAFYVASQPGPTAQQISSGQQAALLAAKGAANMFEQWGSFFMDMSILGGLVTAMTLALGPEDWFMAGAIAGASALFLALMAEANDLANVFQGAVAQGSTWFTHSNTAVLNSEILGVVAKWTGILVAASVVALFLIARSTLGEDVSECKPRECSGHRDGRRCRQWTA